MKIRSVALGSLAIAKEAETSKTFRGTKRTRSLSKRQQKNNLEHELLTATHMSCCILIPIVLQY